MKAKTKTLTIFLLSLGLLILAASSKIYSSDSTRTPGNETAQPKILQIFSVNYETVFIEMGIAGRNESFDIDASWLSDFFDDPDLNHMKKIQKFSLGTLAPTSVINNVFLFSLKENNMVTAHSKLDEQNTDWQETVKNTICFNNEDCYRFVDNKELYDFMKAAFTYHKNIQIAENDKQSAEKNERIAKNDKRIEGKEGAEERAKIRAKTDEYLRITEEQRRKKGSYGNIPVP